LVERGVASLEGTLDVVIAELDVVGTSTGHEALDTEPVGAQHTYQMEKICNLVVPPLRRALVLLPFPDGQEVLPVTVITLIGSVAGH